MLVSAISRSASIIIVVQATNTSKFRDELVSEGSAGGQQAAKLLQEAIDHCIRSRAPDLAHYKVIVQIYMNEKGLKNTYWRVKGFSNFEPFIGGFNRTVTLCKIINAGDDKEAADQELKGKNDSWNLQFTEDTE
jgi:hypothetical protein